MGLVDSLSLLSETVVQVVETHVYIAAVFAWILKCHLLLLGHFLLLFANKSKSILTSGSKPFLIGYFSFLLQNIFALMAKEKL